MSTFDYNILSKDELIRRIEELNELIEQLKKEKDQDELLALPWIGNLGQWNWMFESNELVFNEKKATNLGYTKQDIPKDVGSEFFTDKLHPDDYEKVMDNMRQHLNNQSDAYEVEYRILAKDGSYVWYYDRGKVTKRDSNGKALLVSGIVFDISKNKQIEEDLKGLNNELRVLAHSDSLTGVSNRRIMSRQIIEAIDKAKEDNELFSLVMIDIDDFKIINDTHGHHAGDEALVQLVEIIQDNLDKSDYVSRWGGDEFVLLLSNKKISDALLLAESIQNDLKDIKIEDITPLKVSIGIACYREGDDEDSIVRKADDFMYKSKAKGKSSISFNKKFTR